MKPSMASAFALLLALAASGNQLENPGFELRPGEAFPHGWERAYQWEPENFAVLPGGGLRLATPDGPRTVQSSPMALPQQEDIRFSVHVAAEAGQVRGHVRLIDGRFRWCRSQPFTVGPEGARVEVGAFPTDYRSCENFYARIDIDSPGALILRDPAVTLRRNSPLQSLLFDDMIAVWGGDDVYSWNHRRRGEASPLHPVVPPDFFAGLWREDPLLEGHLALALPYRSAYRDRFVKFRLGRIENAMTGGAPETLDIFQEGYQGVCSLGEHVDNNRFAYSTVSDGVNTMTRITSPFWPGWALRSDSPWMRFFGGMADCGQPSGPAYTALPLEDGIRVRPAAGRLYDAEADGKLTAGWILVWFADGRNGRDVDVPLLLSFSHHPQRIEAEDGLRFDFGAPALRQYTLLPLYGVREVAAAETLGWTAGLPEAVGERAGRWYRSGLAIPVLAHDRWELLPGGDRMRFETRFDYTDRLDEWPEIEALPLAPVSPLIALSFPEVPASWEDVADLDMPLFKGPYYAAAGRDRVAFDLEMPRLRRNPVFDPEMAADDPVAGEMLEYLNSERYYRYLEQRLNHELASDTPMPHVAVEWEGMRVYPFLTPANQERYAALAEKGFREVIFNPAFLDVLYPVRDVFPGAEFEYLNLTVPYGCQESYWNLGRVLAALGDYALATGDYSLYEENWPLIRRMARLTELGGFYQYRYDGGRTLGAVLEGLLYASEAVADHGYHDRLSAIYTLYANTIAGFFRFGEYIRDNGMWNIDGENAALIGGPVQNLTRQNYFTRYDVRDTVWQALGYDLAYGNYHLLRQYAEAPIRRIEEIHLPQSGVDWLTIDVPQRAPNPGFRFAARALVLREDPARLAGYWRRLFAQEAFREDYQYLGPYEAAAAYLTRLAGEER